MLVEIDKEEEGEAWRTRSCHHQHLQQKKILQNRLRERERERENLIYDFLYLVPEAKKIHR
jgi:hypothetical protein